MKPELKTLTKSEKISLGTKEIAKRIRTQLKAEFKNCKFSVRIQHYSSITVSLMKADRKIVKNFSDIPEDILARQMDNGHYTRDELKTLQEKSYHQLNQYTIKDEYDGRYWCNGVFLTEEGNKLLRKVVKIVDYYNYDDSDSMSDYYSVNFSFNLHLGKYDKPFVDGEVDQ